MPAVAGSSALLAVIVEWYDALTMDKREADLLVRTAPGTPCGDLMRRYWQPIALSEELRPGVPRAVKVLHEHLALYRDADGRPGLVDRMCPHRGADLSYARCEDGGLRCLYHGWLFAADGRCLEQPGEPRGSTFHERVSIRAYPCHEAGELIFAYLGPGEPPQFPKFPWIDVPAEQRIVTKIHQRCNYLQAVEGDLDQVHLSFLHRAGTAAKKIDAHPLMTTAAGSLKSPLQLLSDDIAPRIDTERTRFGFREYVTRIVPEGGEYLKVESFVMPNWAIFPGALAGRPGFQAHWHVPIDDGSHWKYVVVFAESGPIDKPRVMLALFGESGEFGPDYRSRRTPENSYLQDRAAMERGDDYAGFGPYFEIQDTWAVEMLGEIQDRTREHLSYSDKSVILLRRCIADGIAELQATGSAPPIDSDGAGDVTDLISIAEIVPAGTNGPRHLAAKVAAKRDRVAASAS